MTSEKKNIFKNKIRHFISFIIKLVKIDGNYYMPSCLAYYLILSFIPLISIVAMILNYISKNSIDALITLLSSLNFLSDSKITEIVHYIQNITVNDIVVLIFSTIASIYVASRGIECFSRFSDHFYGIKILDKHFFKRKARSIGLTLVLILGIVLTFIVLFGLIKPFQQIMNPTLNSWTRYLITWLISFIITSFLFYVAPTKKMKFKSVLPGAFLASLAIILTMFFYGIYLNYAIKKLSSVYGPLTSIILLLLLFFFLCYVFFVFFYFNILLNDYLIKKKISINFKNSTKYDIKNTNKIIYIKQEQKMRHTNNL